MMTQQKRGTLSVKISIIRSARETTANIWARGQPTSCIFTISWRRWRRRCRFLLV